MATDEHRRSWAENPSIRFTLAAMFLSIGVAWLLLLRPDGWMYWVFAVGSLAAGAAWLVRGARSVFRRSH